MTTSAWLTCNQCGNVIGVGPLVDDDAVVDALFDAAELAGWDVTTDDFGPDYCGDCCAARCSDTRGDTRGAFEARKAVQP